MNKRLNILRAKMKQEKIEAFIINNKANRYYLSQFTGTDGQLLITQNQQYIIADGRYFEQLKIQSPDFEVIDNQMQMTKTLVDLIMENNFETVGIEADEMTVSEYLELAQTKCTLVAMHNIIEEQRMIKVTSEKEKIQKAGQIADQTFNHIVEYIQPGMTEKQVAAEIDQYGMKIGATAPAFETIVASGKRSALPHGHASEKVIQNNEMIILDFGFEYEHYFSDITRTIGLGEVSNKLKHVYDVTLAAQKIAIEACCAGRAVNEIDQLARDYITDAGFGDNFLHGTGHGLGLTVHEYPLLNQNTDVKMQPHMTFTVEPGIYLEQVGGVRIEDDVWLDNNGHPVVMTHASKEWRQI
ncbi:M24 family metallopeptidase [Latilactobacillus fuchuensis]|uniref:Xaa-pro dipeptidase n=1 Tax=Latilactobacillus fuchuensis DSM 14340 = JCM 11249 TaxID=1423747 RepID=A0A0R1RZ71_9LACO|nr:aminopeptidase P family protein [Latilactobacillus fuchuensis]KRL61646.1 xaa-pro dipeptidase [Latilactobacillus fuchuensis DSM 14340 = JCM 11249]